MYLIALKHASASAILGSHKELRYSLWEPSGDDNLRDSFLYLHLIAQALGAKVCLEPKSVHGNSAQESGNSSVIAQNSAQNAGVPGILCLIEPQDAGSFKGFCVWKNPT